MTLLDSLPNLRTHDRRTATKRRSPIHLKDQDRREVAQQLAGAYQREKATIRALEAATGLSYGAVHRLLKEAGVTLRTRGGDNRKKGTNHP